MSNIALVPYINSSLGVKVTLMVPATIADLVAAAKSPEDIRLAVIRYSCHQGWNNDFRDAVCTKLAEVTGEKRIQKVVGGVPQVRVNKAGDKETPILETEGDYIKRLKLEGFITETDFASLALAVSATVPFVIKSAEEESEPDAAFFAAARAILAKIDAGSIGSNGQPVTEESFTANFESTNPGHLLSSLGGLTELGIARALEINSARAAREASNGLA